MSGGKYVLLFVVLLWGFLFSVFAQPYGWDWTRQAGGTGDDLGTSIAPWDVWTGSMVTGTFSGTAYFGDSTLTSRGGTDIFVARYDRYGNLIWVESVGGPNDDFVFDIAVDADNDIYLVGAFKGFIVVGTDTFYSTEPYHYDVLVLSFLGDGILNWVTSAGGNDTDFGYGVTVGPDGEVYITGYFRNTAHFGGINLISRGASDIFVAKLSHVIGIFSWAKQGGGVFGDIGYGITSPGAGGDIYVTGGFSDVAFFGNDTIHASGFYNDVFLARYSSSGQLIWVKRAGGGMGYDLGLSMVCDGAGKIDICGHFQDQAGFGGYNLVSAGGTDIFVAQYDLDGNCLWARRAGGPLDDEATDITFNQANNHLWVTGYFQDVAQFGNSTLTSAGGSDMFITEYSSSGVLLNILQVGGEYNEKGNGIACNWDYKILLTGYFEGTVTFGDSTLTSYSLYNTKDVFISQIDVFWVNIENQQPLSTSFELWQNYPNPFNPSTTIHFSLQKAGLITLNVYSITGQRVATLVNRHLSEGKHSVVWNGTDEHGQPVGSGIYLYELVSGDERLVRKMILVK